MKRFSLIMVFLPKTISFSEILLYLYLLKDKIIIFRLTENYNSTFFDNSQQLLTKLSIYLFLSVQMLPEIVEYEISGE
jgi:hypothetical protein